MGTDCYDCFSPWLTEDTPGEDDELPGGGGDDSLAVLQLRVQPCWQGELQLQKTDHLPELLVREPPAGVQAEPESPREQPRVLVDQTEEPPQLHQRPLGYFDSVYADSSLNTFIQLVPQSDSLNTWIFLAILLRPITRVDFPLPLRPQMATFCRAGIVRVSPAGGQRSDISDRQDTYYQPVQIIYDYERDEREA